MTLTEELAQSRSKRKLIVAGYKKELRALYDIIVSHEKKYGTDVTLMPVDVHREVMSAVARATEINSHIPDLKKSFELDKSFDNVDSEIDMMLNGQ